MTQIGWDETEQQWYADFGDGTILRCRSKSTLEDVIDALDAKGASHEPDGTCTDRDCIGCGPGNRTRCAAGPMGQAADTAGERT